jgi:hypothetical protein
MTDESLQRAVEIKKAIDTLLEEIICLGVFEEDTRAGRLCTQRLGIFKLPRKPKEKTYKGFWCSQNLDCIKSIVLFDADEIKVLIDFKRAKIEKLRNELNKL